MTNYEPTKVYLPYGMDLGTMISQCRADSTKWFPEAQRLDTMVLCMAGEVGEVANLVKKVIRGSITVEEALAKGLAEEIVDVLIYLCNLMGLKEFREVDWKAIWDDKRDYNKERFGMQQMIASHEGIRTDIRDITDALEEQSHE